MNKRIILSSLANIADNFENSHEILLANQINLLMTKLAEKEEDCPEPTQDIKLNLKNRQKAINEQGYGPADPSQPNDKFWLKKMKMWKVDELSEVKNMLCGNCAAFDITTKTLSTVNAHQSYSFCLEEKTFLFSCCFHPFHRHLTWLPLVTFLVCSLQHF
jgi:hypothetical protein